jgi:hypothetical protein
MLSLEVCRWCVQSLSNEQWKAVHPALTNEWLERDNWFWQKQSTVRCFYNGGGGSDASVNAAPPKACPFKQEHAAAEAGGQVVLPIGNAPDPRTAPTYIQVTPIPETPDGVEDVVVPVPEAPAEPVEEQQPVVMEDQAPEAAPADEVFDPDGRDADGDAEPVGENAGPVDDGDAKAV